MGLLFYSILASLAGLTTASLCYSLELSYQTYCHHGCCYDNSYFAPCCVEYRSTTVSKGAIVGIVTGVLALIGIIVSVICCCFCAACKRQSSAGQVITTAQPRVAYISQNQSANFQGIPQQQQIQGYNTTANFTVAATQPPAYSEALKLQPQQHK